MSEALMGAYPIEASTGSLPAGIICMWSGSSDNIPSGWHLCNGEEGTPDLTDRFIVGAGSSYAVGATGGEATHVLSASEMPSHTHSITVASSSHTHTVSSSGSATATQCMNVGGTNDRGYSRFYYGSATGTYYTVSLGSVSVSIAASSHTHTASCGSTGSGAAHENRPPYYALCFIMKL